MSRAAPPSSLLDTAEHPIVRHVDLDMVEALLIEAVDAYSPSYSEGPAIDVFAEALERAHLPFRRQPVPGPFDDPDRCNLIVEIGPQPPAFLWVGHIDTIPEHSANPSRHRLDGDRLYGLGAADMKSGCAAIVGALAALMRSGATLTRGVAVAFVVGEEEYGDGSEALLSTVNAPLVVLGEPTGLLPCTSHYGYLELSLEAEGARAHAALPEAGANAIHAMLTWLLGILEDVSAIAASEPIAANPRNIDGGTGLFVVADRCTSTLDVHVPPETDPMVIHRLVHAAREKAMGSHRECRLHSEQVYWSAGYHHAPSDPRLRPLRRAFDSLGEPFEPTSFRSHSDGSQFHQRGSLPVVLGPGFLAQAHAQNEWVSLSQMRRATQLYAILLHEVCTRT